jgi:hypothetical protein
MKFIERNEGAPTLPLETMAADRGRVYVIANNKGGLKAIGFYDKSGRKRRQIDLDLPHKGVLPHVHAGYENPRQDVAMTRSDWAYVRKARRPWDHYRKTG